MAGEAIRFVFLLPHYFLCIYHTTLASLLQIYFRLTCIFLLTSLPLLGTMGTVRRIYANNPTQWLDYNMSGQLLAPRQFWGEETGETASFARGENMTAREMLPAIGSKALVRFESVLVECTISDAKFAYGNARVLVSPVSGQGQQWVAFSRLVSAVSVNSSSLCEHKKG